MFYNTQRKKNIYIYVYIFKLNDQENNHRHLTTPKLTTQEIATATLASAKLALWKRTATRSIETFSSPALSISSSKVFLSL